MKAKSLPRSFDFLGYYFNCSLRLYRSVGRSGNVRCFLIPTSRSLFDYRSYEISKDFACHILSNEDKL